MATLGNIAIGLTARTAGFVRNMRGGRRSLNRFSNVAQTSARRIRGLLVAAAGLAGVAGLGMLIKRSFETGDSLAKTSDKLGMTTEGLARLRHAAALTGIQTTTLDMALQRMTRRVSEAAHGTGEAQGALKELGLNAVSLGDKRPENIFLKIADAMGQVRSPADRLRLSFKLFDSEGAALAVTLGKGKRWLEETGREADKLGISFNRVDAGKIEQANDSITRLKSASTGVFNVLAVKLAPFVTDLATRLTNVGTAGEGAGNRVGGAFDNALVSLSSFADKLDSTYATVLEIGAGLARAGAWNEKMKARGWFFGGTGSRKEQKEEAAIKARLAETWAHDAVTKANAIRDRIARGEGAGARWQEYVHDVNRRAGGGAGGGGGAGAGGGTGPSASMGRRYQGAVVLNRALMAAVTPSGVDRAQEVRSKQLAETNRLLASIEVKVGQPAVAS